MIDIRRGAERSHVTRDGLESWRTFDERRSSDTLCRGFRTLESLNQVNLAPGAVYAHEYAEDVELLTYAWMGAVMQLGADDGAPRPLETGEWSHAHLRAGSVHRTLNGSESKDAHLFQCRFTPDRTRLKTPFSEKRFPLAERNGILRLVLSTDGRNGSLRCRQDARVYSSVLDPGRHIIYELEKKRGVWLHVVSGAVRCVDQVIEGGDGASYVDEPAVSLTAQTPSEILLFDLA